jgi:hypothetical protein
MTAPLHDVCCASLPPESLPALAEVRDLAGIEVALANGRAWVRWEPGDERVLRRVLPVAGVELYARRSDRWYRHGRQLPAFDFPEQADYRPLYLALTPAPVRPVPPRPPAFAPAALTLAADPRPRPASALLCGPAELARWSDDVPARRLAELRAATCAGRVLLLGDRLPPLALGERFWGRDVLVPLGRRPEPNLPPAALRAALGISADELLLLDAAGAEAVPAAAFRPLTRAQLRLALGEGVP